MKTAFKTVFLSFSLNLITCLLILIHPAFLLLILFSLLVQTVVAINYIITGYDTALGQRLLLGIAFLGLVGFSIFIYNYQGM